MRRFLGRPYFAVGFAVLLSGCIGTRSNWTILGLPGVTFHGPFESHKYVICPGDTTTKLTDPHPSLCDAPEEN